MAHVTQHDDPLAYARHATLEAYAICQETIVYCLERSEQYARADLLKRLLDAADINQSMAALLARNSELYERLGVICVVASARCAHACEPYEREDAQMKKCYAAALASMIACGRLLNLYREEETDQQFYDRVLEETFPASDAPPGISMI